MSKTIKQPPATYTDTSYPAVAATTQPLVPASPPRPQWQSATPVLVPVAPLEGRGGRVPPVATTPGGGPGIPGREILQHPDVGGKFTVFVLFYGQEQFFSLHQRCLMSLLNTVPTEALDLRVGSNALNSQSLAMLDQAVAAGRITKHYRHTENAHKYPVMREMFYDPDLPITTKWLMWFDDDTVCDRDPQWFFLLCQTIAQCHQRENAHMIGSKCLWTLREGQAAWYRSRPWHRGRPFRDKTGRGSPNGNLVHFCTGGWWALTAEAMRACDVPDTQLDHNGGDITIGEQIYQGGYNTHQFNGKKQFLHTSSVPRRGDTTLMPGRTRL